MTLFYNPSIEEYGIYAKMTRPDNGGSKGRRTAQKLDPDKEYLVTGIEIGGWHTDIYLEGYNEIFNSVNLSFYQNGEGIDIIEYFRPYFED